MNLRVTKKDITYFVNDFISDCLIFDDFNEGKKNEQVRGLVAEALVLGDSLFQKVNHPLKDENAEGGNKKSVKMTGKELASHYKAVNKELLEGLDKLYQKLSALAKEK